FWGVEAPLWGYLTALPAFLLVAMMLSAIGLFISARIKQLENFAGVMNFVIFPMFFLSSALYPLWKMREASEWLYWVCAWNPFSHGVELIRFALYQQGNSEALIIVALVTVAASVLAVRGFQPQQGMGKR
ncbi:MAG: ABC transporter permease, partial [Amphritea sp.]|nr:ABC transporter permease [Amphritea sp.]